MGSSLQHWGLIGIPFFWMSSYSKLSETETAVLILELGSFVAPFLALKVAGLGEGL